ncbi:GNAT family N-acetyltransferase [Pseudoxanthomonas composti]|uniref:N-acetyltransferase n=1 Tax=Pseudoxanthomonas composti TaxID=2137479 RepID=A0A4Q1JYS4_9GAMM|nr:GNAT family protein [Pseudoxanthomonas composti]RXR07182.1 N-acetyltransferase [Pseudoxanthomonas composti]
MPELVLESSRMRLRLMTGDDWALYSGYYTSAEVMRHIVEPMSEGQARTAFARVCKANAGGKGAYVAWVCVEKGTGAAIGMSALMLEGGVGEVGTIISDGWHSKGLGAEATAAIAGYALQRPDVQVVMTRHRVGNTAAEGLMAKLDFIKEAEPRGDGLQYWLLNKQAASHVPTHGLTS